MLPKKVQIKTYDQGILNLIIKNGEIKNDDIILEIGPELKFNRTNFKKNPKKLQLSKRINIYQKNWKKFGEKITIINKDILVITMNLNSLNQ